LPVDPSGARSGRQIMTMTPQQPGAPTGCPPPRLQHLERVQKNGNSHPSHKS
jgi:hypothetical protein